MSGSHRAPDVNKEYVDTLVKLDLQASLALGGLCQGDVKLRAFREHIHYVMLPTLQAD